MLFPRQSNAVFAELPPYAIAALRREGWLFYTFIGAGGCRFMCTWDTREEDVRQLVADLKRALREAPREVSGGPVDSRKL